MLYGMNECFPLLSFITNENKDYNTHIHTDPPVSLNTDAPAMLPPDRHGQ